METIPNRSDLLKYVVNREGWEAITQSIYDFQTYPAAGTNGLTFFAQPLGANGRTLSDTNMTLAGQMPTNIQFLVMNVQLYFHPAIATVSKTAAAASAQSAIDDAFTFRRGGNLVFQVGSKNYLEEAPLMRFPPSNTFHLESAIALSGAAAVQQTDTGYGDAVGRPYILSPANILLTSNQNFSVRLNWPEGPQPISADARVGVVFGGVLYRRSQ